MTLWNRKRLEANGLQNECIGRRFKYCGLYFKITKFYEDGSANVESDI
jgi:hypothetical protein